MEGYCSKHKDFKNELYCLTENKCICFKCHYYECSNHQTKEIAILKKEKKEIFESDIEILKSTDENITKKFEEIKFNYENEVKRKENLIKEIDIKFNELFDILSNSKSKVINQIESFFKLKDYEKKKF